MLLQRSRRDATPRARRSTSLKRQDRDFAFSRADDAPEACSRERYARGPMLIRCTLNANARFAPDDVDIARQLRLSRRGAMTNEVRMMLDDECRAAPPTTRYYRPTLPALIRYRSRLSTPRRSRSPEARSRAAPCRSHAARDTASRPASSASKCQFHENAAAPRRSRRARYRLRGVRRDQVERFDGAAGSAILSPFNAREGSICTLKALATIFSRRVSPPRRARYSRLMASMARGARACYVI